MPQLKPSRTIGQSCCQQTEQLLLMASQTTQHTALASFVVAVVIPASARSNWTLQLQSVNLEENSVTGFIYIYIYKVL